MLKHALTSCTMNNDLFYCILIYASKKLFFCTIKIHNPSFKDSNIDFHFIITKAAIQ